MSRRIVNTHFIFRFEEDSGRSAERTQNIFARIAKQDLDEKIYNLKKENAN